MYYGKDVISFNNRMVTISLLGDLFYCIGNDFYRKCEPLSRTHFRWDNNGIDLMQYIGRKDKNGKEIYEGDIISTPYYTLDEFNKEITINIIADVFFCEDGLKFSVNPPGGLIVEIGEESKIEVLGNIYENPELLGDSDVI
jgi:uncharacterized phage protein (TIGR01671 family)